MKKALLSVFAVSALTVCLVGCGSPLAALHHQTTSPSASAGLTQTPAKGTSATTTGSDSERAKETMYSFIDNLGNMNSKNLSSFHADDQYVGGDYASQYQQSRDKLEKDMTQAHAYATHSNINIVPVSHFMDQYSFEVKTAFTFHYPDGSVDALQSMDSVFDLSKQTDGHFVITRVESAH